MSNATDQQTATGRGSVVVGDATVIGRLTVEELRTTDGETLVRLTLDGRSSTYTLARLELELSAVLHKDHEGPVIQYVDWLPMDDGRNWLRFEGLDVVAINSRLDDAGRKRALAEAGA